MWERKNVDGKNMAQILDLLWHINCPKQDHKGVWAKYGANIGQSLVQNMGKIWTRQILQKG